MNHSDAGGKSGSDQAGWFVTTHWSVVLQARDGGPAQADGAMEKLCRTYWPPLYAFIRREGYAPHDAQDLTQEFLGRLVHKEWLHHLQDCRGKFRSFLLTFLKHFLADQRDRDRAQKRGGGRQLVPLDAYEAEERQALEPSDGLTPELAYERRWAEALFSSAIERLRDEYISSGRADLFDALKDFQPGRHTEEGYASIGARLGLSESGVKSAVLRLRRRHHEILREQIANTVAGPDEIEPEVRHLISVIGG